MKTKISLALLTAMLALLSPSWAQNPNLLPYPNFQVQGSDWIDGQVISTQYTYATAPSYLNGTQGEGKMIVAGNSQNVHGDYYNCTGRGGGTNNRFLVVNGFGGTRTYAQTSGTPSNKRILRYTITGLIPNVLYDFYFWATNLSNGTHSMATYVDARVKFRVACNGTSFPDVFRPIYEENTPVWTKSPIYRLQSDGTGKLVITLYDDCEWLAGYGDDFGIDDASLVLAPGYSVDVENFQAYGCDGSFDAINLFNESNPHATITQPEGQPSLPTVIKLRRNQSNDWATTSNSSPISTDHGQAYVGSDNKIYYSPEEGYIGTDQVQYKVEKYGLSDWATITFHSLGSPSNFQVFGFPEDHWCKGDEFSFYATCVSNGAPLQDSLWQWAENNTNPQWNTLNFSQFPSSASCHDYYLRYKAENACGPAYSETMLLHVCDEPELFVTSISAPDVICEGGSLPDSYLSQDSVSDWRNDIGTAGWWVKPVGGSWQALAGYEEGLHNGDKLQYRAENCCGSSETNEVTITATEGPEFNAPTPSFNSYYCVGDVLQLPATPPAYDDNGITISDAYWARSTDGESYTKINGNPTLNLEWHDNYICYRLVCPCGTVDSDSPFQLKVYGAPVYETPLDTLDNPYCADDLLYAPVPPVVYSHEETEYGWAISSTQDSTSNFSPVTLPLTLTPEHNGKWLRHWAQGCSSSLSNAVQIHVDYAPTLTSNTLPGLDDVCAGSPIVLPEMDVVSWNGDTIGNGWEIYHNGAWEVYLPGSPLSMDYDGALLRYWAQSSCGRSETETTTINMIQGPVFTETGALEFQPYYCAVDGTTLEYPEAPSFQDNGSNAQGYWAWSEDNVDYAPITTTITLTEEWNGRYISYLLQSDCGSDIRYPNPFQLTVYGAPQIDSLQALDQPFCPTELLYVEEPAYYSNPNSDDGWQLGDGNGQWTDIEMPYVLSHDDDGKRLRFYVSGCELGYSNEVEVLVGDSPTLTLDALEAPHDVCSGDGLDPAYLNAVSVDSWNHFYTEGESFERWEMLYQGQWLALPETFTLAFDGFQIRYHAVNDCGETTLGPVTLHVIEQPLVNYGITPALCTGQLLNYELLSSNNAPVEGWVWKFMDEEGDEVEFDPDTYLFEEEGVFQVSYAVYNFCNADDPSFSDPVEVTVTAGPQFAADSGWPEVLAVCDGVTLAEALAENNIDVPALENPDVAHAAWGWFFKHKDENNNMVYDELSSAQLITETCHGYELCYAVKGECSSEPIYSAGLPLHVYGHPEILSLSLSQSFCAGENFPPADFLPDIDTHHNTVTTSWQRLYDGQWEEVAIPFAVQSAHDNMQLRFRILADHCGYEDQSDPVVIRVASVPEIVSEISSMVQLCDGGALGLAAPEVIWHNTLPEEGVWQVSNSPEGPFGVGPFGPGSLMFDPDQVSSDFDGWYLRYHVEGCGTENNSNVAEIGILQSADVQISGEPVVAQMNNYWPGVYYYTTEVEGSLNWTLTPPIWPVEPLIVDGKACCKLTVTTGGQATLTAAVGDGSCGMDDMAINASQFDVEEQQGVKAMIFPNPAQQSVTVVADDITAVVVYNILGQQLKHVNVPSEPSVSLDIAELAEALYIVEVRTREGVTRQRLTVSR